ncbi:hypothetical protein [uncultured Roseobacter sp.]|uniref:hypothetical protein n=1 Tax=uncultured Roseobacter sp. TaxID=114847 RepID=UPI00260DDC1C|nr:hypothetical protein [uncultured Roseobacter sp.]
MAKRREPASALSPEQEDRGLFRTYGGPIEVELVPRLSRDAAGDVVIHAFFKGVREISVMFPGRRAREIGPLHQHLRWLDSRARRAAVAARRPSPSPDLVRLSVQVKGAWRQQSRRDDDDIENGIYQLVAARWAFTDQTGTLVQFGEAPAYDMTARQRPKSYILTTREIDAVQRSRRTENAD